ncbi:MAG: GNAT family N-acetyltransferase [Kordiimonadaceae bacterium]|jgi:GNAT superfamily N-acetyltransferase|nr:GNAT family N-acetyltransferase [Kordiimonadaceae bacterium]MBT6035677.1 GNAT family N-acetyltransferase [Kordiimonadaceae bacterium]MBT6330624.1 GNAT family N-acetyltransferase [Kordiimonadaceae bacterium]MBT7583398.1 GNAT family N-acetyltransferase [Kordiimonadaceae bacterium]
MTGGKIRFAYTIKIATPVDVAAINSVLDASFSSLLTSIYDDVSLAQILPKITQVNPDLLSSGTYYIALNKNEEIVGCGGWTHQRPGTTDRTDGQAHIRHFATHPEYVGYGVARALYNHCVTEAKNENVSEFECYSTLNAEFFYKALGFKSIKLFDLNMGGDLTFPSILMQADI